MRKIKLFCLTNEEFQERGNIFSEPMALTMDLRGTLLLYSLIFKPPGVFSLKAGGRIYYSSAFRFLMANFSPPDMLLLEGWNFLSIFDVSISIPSATFRHRSLMSDSLSIMFPTRAEVSMIEKFTLLYSTKVSSDGIVRFDQSNTDVRLNLGTLLWCKLAPTHILSIHIDSNEKNNSMVSCQIINYIPEMF